MANQSSYFVLNQTSYRQGKNQYWHCKYLKISNNCIKTYAQTSWYISMRNAMGKHVACLPSFTVLAIYPHQYFGILERLTVFQNLLLKTCFSKLFLFLSGIFQWCHCHFPMRYFIPLKKWALPKLATVVLEGISSLSTNISKQLYHLYN